MKKSMFMCFMFVFFFSVCSPALAAERTVELTIPGCGA